MKTNKTSIKLLSILIITAILSISMIGIGERELKGKVTDKSGDPIENVTITLKPTKDIIKTDQNGEYSIRSADELKQIVFSKKVYKKQEIKMKNFSVLNVELSKK